MGNDVQDSYRVLPTPCLSSALTTSAGTQIESLVGIELLILLVGHVCFLLLISGCKGAHLQAKNYLFVTSLYRFIQKTAIIIHKTINNLLFFQIK